ncbi:unnamed protein product [Durusdinium trenchii]|uniref:Pseudouridine synthase RsuA/RluA-like domain-containing protein n=1 Tax=Durusdinium trenchii TaxID=1381693 RepID=A0ABP0RQ42_9DINO
MPLTIAEVKKALSFIWGKERDLNETYAFEFNSAWSCVRSNGGESRRFRLSFDASAGRLWWGQSYFMDPDDLLQKPEKVQWYRASDPKKSRAAFVWKRLREAREVAHKSAVPKVATARPAGTRPPSGTEKAPKIYVEKSKRSPEKGQQSPEIMLDLDQVLVIYKPPHWKVELPSNTQDGLYLPSWLQEKVEGIDPKLFEVESNPALSGTGFGPLSHRIDQETSGPLLAARTRTAHKHLRAQFHKTEVSKRYVCLVHGRVSQAKGIVNAHIRTLRTDATTRSEISASGDWAETRYQVIATYDSVRGLYSLLACDITSGRTHQIRVHMQHLGHPLVSDDKYASETLEEDRAWCPRLFLHCYRLRFKDMRNSVQLVSCPLPSDLKAALSRLGAADGPSNDLLFEETSWQREVFRVPAMAWRPGTEVQRHLCSMLTRSEPLLLSEVNRDPELQRLMAKEHLSSIDKAWLAKNYDTFEVLNVHDDDAISVKLRPIDEATELEQQIEAARSEYEELQRQKQRAIAEEQYLQAGEIKRRVEAAEAELSNLMALAEALEKTEEVDEGVPVLKSVTPVAFQEDVRDEALFPSLGSKPKVMTLPRFREEKEDERGPEPVEPVVSLKDALLSFLDSREGYIAHINEINNDRTLKEVMAAQQKPLMAVNKAWLKQHEEDFTLFRANDNEMYVAKTEAVASQKAARAKTNSEQKKQPAYQQVIQKADAEAAPLVYEFSHAKKEDEDLNKVAGAEAWLQKFQEALEGSSRTAKELLADVPLFAPAMGATRPRQQEELLVTFLQTWPKSFKVEKRGSGAERSYLVSLR